MLSRTEPFLQVVCNVLLIQEPPYFIKKTVGCTPTAITSHVQRRLVTLHGVHLTYFFQLFARCGLLFPVLDRGRLFEIFALFPFSNDTLFLDHSLEFLDRLLERFIVVYSYVSYGNHPLPNAWDQCRIYHGENYFFCQGPYVSAVHNLFYGPFVFLDRDDSKL